MRKFPFLAAEATQIRDVCPSGEMKNSPFADGLTMDGGDLNSGFIYTHQKILKGVERFWV